MASPMRAAGLWNPKAICVMTLILNVIQNPRLPPCKHSEIVWLPAGRTASTSTNADALTGLPNTYAAVTYGVKLTAS
jgi:hypothetical protein